MNLLIRAPWLAFAVGAIFLAFSWPSRSTLAIAIAIAWFLYGVYEYLMHFRVLCTGECNIRVDLLLIYPILLILTILAIVVSLRRRQK